MKRCFIIDDEPGSLYIDNIRILIQEKGYNVIMIPDVSKARKQIQESDSEDCFIIDLMMPEIDKTRELPRDICEIGIGLCKDLINREDCDPQIAILTNAKPERHQIQLNEIDSIIKKYKNITLTYKYKTKSIEFADNWIKD